MCIRDRFWIFGILLGICVTAASLYYFFQAEEKEAENRMVKTVNYVKAVSYTHLDVYKRQGKGCPLSRIYSEFTWKEAGNSGIWYWLEKSDD